MPREMTNAESELVTQLNAAIDSGNVEQIRVLFESFKDKCGTALCEGDCPPDLYGIENRLASVGVYISEPFPDALRGVEAHAAPVPAPVPAAEVVLYEDPADAVRQAMGDAADADT